MLILLMDANDDNDNQQRFPSHLTLVCGCQHCLGTGGMHRGHALTEAGRAADGELMVRDGN